ncbi:CPBP family intramembrane glutamic endopeptidase [Bacillus salacetis]|uniref:CPBP family intramembrane glutamic endopeptidase n=1 Tax=Bacillus salacetis TaxID=2315464 RepID=UPI003BA1A41F
MIIFGLILLIFLIGVYPFWDKKYTSKLEKTLLEKDRIAYFKYVIFSEWTITLMILLVVMISASTFGDLGFKAPAENSSEVLGMLTGFLAGILIMMFVLMRLPFYRKYLDKQTENVSYLIPSGRIDKRFAILAAITAGICEEVIYRGFLLHFLSSSPFGLEGQVLMIMGAAIFGIAHYYQGWKGVLLTGVVGYAFTRMYFMTGSLLFPILFHIIIDLRFMLMAGKDPVDKTDLKRAI